MSEEFNFHELLAGPIRAANDAQADVALGFVEQLKHFAFEPQGADAVTPRAPARTLREIAFVANAGIDADGRQIRQEISMPLLQLVPLSGLLIDNAKVEFSCEVSAQKTPTVQKTAVAGGPVLQRSVAQPTQLKGRIAPTTGKEGQPSGNLKVELYLKKADLPSGYLDMIAATHATTRAVANDPPAQLPLFEAAIRGPRSLVLAPAQETVIELVVKSNVPALSASVLEISVASGSPEELIVLDPKGAIPVSDAERTLKVSTYLRKRAAPKSVALLVSGTARSANGGELAFAQTINIPVNQRT